MISFKRAYVATINGKEQVFANLHEAQAMELASLLLGTDNEGHWHALTPTEIIEAIVRESSTVVSILTLNDASRPRARGQKKPRRKAQDELPLVKENAA